MHSARARVLLIASLCTVFVPAVPAAAQVAAADEQAIEQLVARLYDARVRKDVAAVAALYSSNAPQRVTARHPANFVFPYERLEVARVSVANLKQVVNTMTGRVTAQVTVTATPVDEPRTERWVRNVGFVKEGDAWMLWREAPAAEDLAVEIGRAQSPEERQALIDGEADLLTEELAFALEAQGDRLFVSAIRAALPLYVLELQIGERIHAVAAAARAHLKMAQVLQLTDVLGVKDLPEQYRATAAEHFQKALDLFTACGDRGRMASAEVGIATSLYMKDDVRSRAHYENAIAILETLPDRVVLANALHGYGNACFMVGDYSAALDAYRRSMDVQANAGVRTSIAALWQAIGRVQKKQGDYEAALDSCRRSLADPGLLDPATEVGSMLELADVYRLQGRFELALDEYGRTLALVRAREDGQAAMRVEADIANVYMAEQQPAAAQLHYQKSAELAQQLRNEDGIGRALAGLGLAHFAQMRHDAALDAFSKALAIREAAGDKSNIAWLHAHIGLVQSATGRHQEALDSFQKALALGKDLSETSSIAVMQALLAAEHAELDHPEQALELADQAAAVARTIESDDTLARAKVIAARVLRANGDVDGARRALEEAMAALEAGRARSADEPPEGFFGDTRGAYREMALLQSEIGESDDRAQRAMAFAERAHVALLADVLTGNRSLVTNGLRTEEQEAERQLSRACKSLHVQVEKEQGRARPDSARLADLKKKLQDVEQQRAAVVEKIYGEHPTLKLQRGFFQAGTTSDFGPLLDDGTTLVVEYVTAEKQTLVIAAAKSPSARNAARSDARSGSYVYRAFTVDVSFLDLTRQVREYRAAIRDRDPEIKTLAQELHRTLVAPWQDLLVGRSRLIVVPDGPLWSLPFQALQGENGKFLIESSSVSYAPSLTALTLVGRSALASSSPHRPRRVVALANQRAGSATARLQLLNASANLAPMPNAQVEARRLTEVYGPARVRVYAGAAARKDAVEGDAQTAGVLHLATFLVPSAASPLRSPMVFSVDRDGQAEVVEAWELMRTALPPTTVVSRVQVDRVGGDEAVRVGLSWVLFVAGSKTIVLATWPDDSPGATALMLGLHRGLSSSPAVAPARALRRAILPLLATKYRHPFYWANYMVIGE